MAWDEPLSSPVVLTLTVTVSPFSLSLAVPLPVTWLVGTGCAAAANGSPPVPAGALPWVVLDELPPLSATAAPMAPATTSASTAKAGHL